LSGQAPIAPDASTPFVPGEVVIDWRPAPAARAQVRPGRLDGDRASPAWRRAAEDVAARAGLAVLDLAPEYGMARLAVPPGAEAAEVARLAALPWVTHAGPNYLAHSAGYPNDPRIGEQWHMRRIAAPAAWDLTFGSYSIVVAVIDSGVDLGHPEFAGRLLPGFDYVNWDDTPNDDNGHGTHVTGIIAAAANNSSGVAGLAANVKILPLKVLDSQGSGAYYNIATALRRAADSGVQVINLSLGGFSDDALLQDAIKYATDRNIFVAAAAGNCAQGGSECATGVNPIYYPAACPGVFAVAASDHFDNWANYSGYKYYVALAAPGGLNEDEIVSTLPGGYGWKFGTSMATAQASAAAALVLTYQPAATYTQVADILKNTADKVGPYTYIGGRNDWFGAGRLNVGRAVRWAYPPSLQSTTAAHRFLLGGPITQASATLPILNGSNQPVTWQATEQTGASWLRLTPGRGVTSYSAPDTLTLQAGPTALAPGEYDAVILVRAVAPSSGSFQIYVTLKIADGVRQGFLPLVANQMQAAHWVDPAAGGIAIYPTNDTPYQVGLPFPVTFYGQSRNALSVSFKGFVSFTQPGSGATVAQSACLPTAALPNDAIYVLWQNWDAALGGQVFVHYPDADRFVVTWFQMRRFLGDLPHAFQLVLFRDGGLTLQYRAVQAPVQGTIGIENWDGTVATQIACNGVGRLPTDDDAFSLTAQLPW
jgi:thermitase